MPDKFKVSSKKETKTSYSIHIWDSIEKYEDYDKLLDELDNIGKDDNVTLSISSPGGRCDVGFMLYDKLAELSNVEVIVPYPSYSMGALLSLVGNSLELLEGSFLMFHDFSTGHRGKGNEIEKSISAYSEVFRYRFNKICQPFLTKKECEDILEGKDLYVKWNDDNLEQRIKRHFR